MGSVSATDSPTGISPSGHADARGSPATCLTKTPREDAPGFSRGEESRGPDVDSGQQHVRFGEFRIFSSPGRNGSVDTPCCSALKIAATPCMHAFPGSHFHGSRVPRSGMATLWQLVVARRCVSDPRGTENHQRGGPVVRHARNLTCDWATVNWPIVGPVEAGTRKPAEGTYKPLPSGMGSSTSRGRRTVILRASPDQSRGGPLPRPRDLGPRPALLPPLRLGGHRAGPTVPTTGNMV